MVLPDNSKPLNFLTKTVARHHLYMMPFSVFRDNMGFLTITEKISRMIC